MLDLCPQVYAGFFHSMQMKILASLLHYKFLLQRHLLYYPSTSTSTITIHLQMKFCIENWASSQKQSL